MSLTSWQIAMTLMRERHLRNFCIPNYTPLKWWECDVFEVTPAGYFREYEIKLSRGDFRADAHKESRVWTGNIENGFEQAKKNKHDEIAKASVFGPCKFWYVCPVGLI